MQSAIQEKIQLELNAGITKESQVVYILAGIRKILEQLEDITEFEHLKFYCDWALHHKLSGPPAQKVMRILEFIYNCMAKGERAPTDSEATHLIRFELLKNELSGFLQKFDIKNFTQSANTWVVFIYLYCRVVEDCPLVMRSNTPMNIQKIVISLDTAEDLIEDHQPYQVNWQFEAKEGLAPARYFIINSYSVAQIGRL